MRRKRWRRRNEGIQYSRKSIRVTGNVAKRKQRRKEKHGFVRKRTTEDVCISKEKKKKKKEKRYIYKRERNKRYTTRTERSKSGFSRLCPAQSAARYCGLRPNFFPLIATFP